jgi:Ca2+-binding RTX toxin-like protein
MAYNGGTSGNDSQTGVGSANDTFMGGAGNDSLYGGDGNDVLVGGADNDLISGGTGADSILGQEGADSISGDDGNDTIIGGAGNDTVDGGDGNDYITESTNLAALQGDLANGFFSTTGSWSLVPATGAAPVISGGYLRFNTSNKATYGDYAQQTVQTTPGATYTVTVNAAESGGGVGNHDILVEVIDQNGTVIGTSGVVTILDGAAAQNIPVTYVATTPGMTIRITNTGSTSTTSTDLYVDSAVNTLVSPPPDAGAAGGDDSMSGGAGNDTILSGQGNDSLYGGTGNDDLRGEQGNDSLDGGDGNDTLRGEQGNDHLDGGAGNDSMNGGAGNDTGYGGAGNDYISDSDEPGTVYNPSFNISNGAGWTEINPTGGTNQNSSGVSFTWAPGTALLNSGDAINNGDGIAQQISTTIGAQYQITVDAREVGGGNADHQLLIEAIDDNGLVIASTSLLVTNGSSVSPTLNYVATTAGTTIRVTNPSSTGSNGSDLYIDAVNNVLTASTPSTDSDLYYGGTGDDTIHGDDPDFPNSGGNDSLYGGEDNDQVYGGAGNDLVHGDGGNDALYGGTGDDSIAGGGGNDTAYGGDGDDTITDINSVGTEAAGTVTNNEMGQTPFVGWTPLNPTGGQGPVQGVYNNDAYVAFNSGNEASYGDGIEQTITTTAGSRYTLTLQAGELGGGNADHTILIEVLDGSGNVIATRTEVVANMAQPFFTIDYIATGAATTIRISNPTSTGTASSDLVVWSVNNTLVPTTYDDTFYGDAGNDLLDGAYGNDSLFGGADNDTLYGGAGNDSLNGGDGNDVVYGDDTAGTFAGNDSIQAGLGDDLVYGGQGTDTIYGDNSADTVAGGNDTIYAGDGNESVFGGAGNDQLHGDAGNDSLFGGNGNDQVHGDAGNDSLDGGAGNDTIWGDDTAGIVTGNDYIQAGQGADLIYGGQGNDTIYGDNANDTVTGGADTIYAGDGNESVFGGADNDLLYGDGGNDSLFGGNADDSLYGGAGNDSLDGGLGYERLYGGAGNDTLIGGGGIFNDTLDGGEGNDVLTGGAGSDVFIADGTADRITDFDISNNADNNQLNNDFVDLSQFYNTVTLAAWNAANPGQQYADPLTWLRADQADGTLQQAGNFQIYNGGSAVAGSGLTYDNTNVNSRDGIVEGTQNDDHIDAGYNGDPNGDHIDANDAILPGDGPNDDVVYGYNGNDSIESGLGNDEVYGGHHNDTIYGGTGDDTLVGDGPSYTIPGSSGTTSGNLVSNGTFTSSTAGWIETATTPGGLATIDNAHGGLGFNNPPEFNHVTAYTEVTAPAGATSLTVSLDYTEWSGSQQLSGLNTYLDMWLSTTPGGLPGTILLGPVKLDTGTGVTLHYNSGSVPISGTGPYYLIFTSETQSGYNPVIDNVVITASTPASPPVTVNPIGDDLIYGEDGNDSIQGNGGNDTLYGGADNDTIEGGDGNDSIGGDAGNDSLYGGAGNDEIAGGAGADQLFGGTGNDTLTGGQGADTMEGGDNDDLLIGDGGDGVTGQADEIYGGLGNDTIHGNGGHDSLFGDQGNDEIYGESGNDTINGGDGNDKLYGGANEDSIVGGTGNDSIDGGDDNDTLVGDVGDDTIEGGLGDDLLVGESGNDALYGGEGNDTISGGDDNDSIAGGAGDDLIAGDDGQDYVQGGTGNDTIYGGTNVDTLYGGDGHDVFYGGSQSDAIYGGDGNDLIYGDGGIDYAEGGFGNDTFAGHFQGGDEVVGGEDPGDGDIDVLDLSYIKSLGYDFHIVYGGGNDEAGNVIFDSGPYAGQSFSFSEIETVIICFAQGTMITTDEGEIAVEDLRQGDRVLTRDNGYRPVRWIGRARMSAGELALKPHLRPIRIKAGALGRNMPTTDLVVSPQHRILVSSVLTERMFGEREVLMAAKHLTVLEGISVAEDLPEVEYWHFLLDQHQIVLSNGAATESLFTGPEALKAVPEPSRAEILEIFPALAELDHAALPAPARLLVPGRRARQFARRVQRNHHDLIQ